MSIRPLPDYLQKVVENKLNEVPERVCDDIKVIKEWLVKQPHINGCVEDQWILTFLRGCRFCLKTTKEMMEEFYLLRTLMPDYFMDRDPLLPEIQELLNRNILLPLPLNPQGPQVFIVRCDGGDINTLPLKTVLKGGIMMMDMILRENDHLMMGEYVIIDLELLQYSYTFQLTPSMIKMLVRGVQKAYPTHPKGIFVLNFPIILQAAYYIAYPLVDKRILDRVHFYTKDNLEELKRFIPSEIIPIEYGGTGDSIDTIRAQWKTKMENYRDWFIQSSQYKIDESKRIKQ